MVADQFGTLTVGGFGLPTKPPVGFQDSAAFFRVFNRIAVVEISNKLYYAQNMLESPRCHPALAVPGPIPANVPPIPLPVSPQ